MPTSSCELTILMPCLNEAETLEVCVRKAQAYLTSSGVDGEVLIADNGSTDGSQEIAERLGARVVTNRFVNSLAADPGARPFWDPVTMVYPRSFDWPEGTIDLQGPGY